MRLKHQTFFLKQYHKMKMLKTLLLIGFAVVARADAQTNLPPPTETPGQSVETIVYIRHGEKPHSPQRMAGRHSPSPLTMKD